MTTGSMPRKDKRQMYTDEFQRVTASWRRRLRGVRDLAQSLQQFGRTSRERIDRLRKKTRDRDR